MDAADATLTVFAPSPILTVTIERDTGGDPELHVHAGGQGVGIARMAAGLGGHVTLCAALGGETGRVLSGLLADEGIQLSTTSPSGPNVAYVHDRRTSAGPAPSRAQPGGRRRRRARHPCLQ
jgi:1-phosphofructokinase